MGVDTFYAVHYGIQIKDKDDIPKIKEKIKGTHLRVICSDDYFVNNFVPIYYIICDRNISSRYNELSSYAYFAYYDKKKSDTDTDTETNVDLDKYKNLHLDDIFSYKNKYENISREEKIYIAKKYEKYSDEHHRTYVEMSPRLEEIDIEELISDSYLDELKILCDNLNIEYNPKRFVQFLIT